MRSLFWPLDLQLSSRLPTENGQNHGCPSTHTARPSNQCVPSLGDGTCEKTLIRPLGAIERILSLNHEETSGSVPSIDAPSSPQATSLLGENGEPIWKVLVFDNLGRDIISSVLRVNDLRAKGVTIHL